jgi:outer membrane protein assembly factor BamA
VNQNRNFRRVNYGIRVTQYNFRGRAERLRVVAQTGFEDRLLFNYRIPYIDKKQRYGIMPEVLIINTKNLGFETDDHLRNFISAERDMLRSAGVVVWNTLRRSKLYEFHNLGIGFQRVAIDDTIAFLNPDFLGNANTEQRAFSLAYAYQNNRRNNVNYPLTGYNLYAEISKVGLGIYDDLDYFTLVASASKYWDLGNDFYFATRGVGYFRDGKHPFYNYNGLGFDPLFMVRGYELDLIETPTYFLSKNSVRKLLFNRKYSLKKFVPIRQFQTLHISIYGKLFMDAAYAWNYPGYENNERLTDTPIYSLGAGLDFVLIYDLVFRLEYSVNAGGERQFFINFMRDI